MPIRMRARIKLLAIRENFIDSAGLRLPRTWPCGVTLKRQLNFRRNNLEYARGKTYLRSYPWILSVEPTNACNLRCPFCFTGASRLGRARSVMSLDLFRSILDEIGDYLVLLKLYSWGEPMLCRHLETMIADAHARGIYTVVNTNLSLPFAARRAEALVASGLSELVVSIDGSRQEIYERYRVGGDIDLVRANVALLNAAKRRLGSIRPTLAVEFHPFPWNAGDTRAMEPLAGDLEAALRVFKGCVPGTEWGPDEDFSFCVDPAVIPCTSLWSAAVIAADGGVAGCTGTADAADDMGRIDPARLARKSFRSVWNNARYRAARRFFLAREGTAAERAQVCFDCPSTVTWERWRRHRAAGGDHRTFTSGTTNEAWNYFWQRGRVPMAAVDSTEPDSRAAAGG